MKLQDERRDYERAQLRRNILAVDPFKQFTNWFTEAKKSGLLSDPTAFTLATVNAKGQPHQRIVLLKEYDHEGFVFYTNYASAKGNDIAANPLASMHFAWLPLEQQIRIEGSVEKVSEQQSADYFSKRPRESQLGALASAQSSPIANREELEARYQQLTKELDGKPVPKPETWGGYRVIPNCFEFWQGGRYRLHDRFTYTKDDNQQNWSIVRLQP